MSHYTCKELGVCNCPEPECQDRTRRWMPLREAFQFRIVPTSWKKRPMLAPGMVVGYRVGWLGTPAQRRDLVRLVRYCAGWGAVMVAAGWLLGIAAGVWQ